MDFPLAQLPLPALAQFRDVDTGLDWQLIKNRLDSLKSCVSVQSDMMPSKICLIALIAIVTSFSQSRSHAAHDKPFQAGAAASNITPKIGGSIMGYFNERHSTHVHDELHARCLVLDDGQTRIAIVVCDNCMIPRDILDEAKRRIEKQCGIPADHILISSTHTHSSPTCTGLYLSEVDKEYIPFVTARIVDGVKRAVNNLVPAKIAWGAATIPDQVFNRRWKMKPGSIPANPFGRTNELVKMNPPVASPDLIEPAGPTDPELSIVAVQSLNNRPIALLANYSLHYVGTSNDKDVTADYFGAFCERIANLLGAEHQDPPFVALLSNGTSGDINNIDFRHKRALEGPYDRMRFVADVVAREALRAYGELKFQDWVPLKMQQQEIKLGVRKPTSEEVAHAQTILDKAKGRELRGLPEVYARETMFIKDYPDEVPVILQTIRIGNLGVAAMPAEVFAEIGLEIKKRSPLKPTFTIELANGCSGYLPTPAQHKLGGYETWRARSSYLEENAAPKMVETLMDMFEHLR